MKVLMPRPLFLKICMVWDNVGMAASDHIQGQLFGESVGRISPDQEAKARRDILTSHGNKHPAIIEQVATSTSTPTSDLHILRDTPIRMMNMSEREENPGVAGYARSPLVEAREWVGNPNNAGKLRGQIYPRSDEYKRPEIKEMSNPLVAIHPAFADPGSVHPDLTDYGPTTVAHEIGHAVSSDRIPLTANEMTSDDKWDTKRPASEGSAEGYSARYTAPDAPNDSVYTPEHFERTKTGKEAPHGPELFSRAHNWTRSTGQSLDSGDFRKISDMSHVLDSDYHEDSYGDEGPNKDGVGTSRADVGNRMAINEITRRDSSVKAPQFEDERRKREMAVNGQHVQGSLLPDLVPETNQYGDSPVDSSEIAPSIWGNHLKTKQQASVGRLNAWGSEQQRQERLRNSRG